MSEASTTASSAKVLPVASFKAAPDETHFVPTYALNEAKLEEAVTTVMIRNIARTVTQEQLMTCLDTSGFAGTYDFAYLPFRSRRRRNLGFAFVNFTTPYYAQQFYHQCHRSNTLAPRGEKSRYVTVSSANVQGRQENVRLIEESCVANLGNLDHRPVAFVYDRMRHFV